jgi:hypothetical protein
LRRSKIHVALNLMLPHTEGTVINQSLKIEIVEVKNSSQQNGRYMLPFFFRERLHAYTTNKKVHKLYMCLYNWFVIENHDTICFFLILNNDDMNTFRICYLK